MLDLDYWRLCDELTVVQAASLIAGSNPADKDIQKSTMDLMAPDVDPNEKKYLAAFSALKNAIMGGSLSATKRHDARGQQYDEYPSFGETMREDKNGYTVIFQEEPNWDMTTIKTDDLKIWLTWRGFKSGFFFPDEKNDGAVSYLDEKNVFFAPKLAAAIRAWEAVSGDKKLQNGKTPKQAMQKWLRENASRYGLTKEDGNPNETGIEEICKVANWNPEGGAAKTPANANPPTPEPTEKQKKFSK